jgi:hypothetical protein
MHDALRFARELRELDIPAGEAMTVLSPAHGEPVICIEFEARPRFMLCLPLSEACTATFARAYAEFSVNPPVVEGSKPVWVPIQGRLH